MVGRSTAVADGEEAGMYGTVAKMRAQPGKGDLLEEMGRQLRDDRPPEMVAIYVYRMDADPDVFMMAVVFDSKESYVANAESPEQDARYRRLRELLAEDPEWHDGEIVQADAP